MCEYCEKGKRIEEAENDNIYFEIYGKHLRVIGKVLNIPLGRDIIIEYCPMCRKEAGRLTVGDLIKRLEKVDKNKMCIHREFKDSIGWANLAIEEKEKEVTFYGDMSSPWSDE